MIGGNPTGRVGLLGSSEIHALLAIESKLERELKTLLLTIVIFCCFFLCMFFFFSGCKKNKQYLGRKRDHWFN